MKDNLISLIAATCMVGSLALSAEAAGRNFPEPLPSTAFSALGSNPDNDSMNSERSTASSKSAQASNLTQENTPAQVKTYLVHTANYEYEARYLVRGTVMKLISLKPLFPRGPQELGKSATPQKLVMEKFSLNPNTSSSLANIATTPYNAPAQSLNQNSLAFRQSAMVTGQPAGNPWGVLALAKQATNSQQATNVTQSQQVQQASQYRMPQEQQPHARQYQQPTLYPQSSRYEIPVLYPQAAKNSTPVLYRPTNTGGILGFR